MSSIINSNELTNILRSRWDPRGDVVVIYIKSNPPRRFKSKVHYICLIDDSLSMIHKIQCSLLGLRISKVFYTENGVDFTQIKIAPSNS